MSDKVDYSQMPNWKLVEIAAKYLSKKNINGLFTRREIIDYINNVLLKGIGRNPDSLNPIIQAVTANAHGGAPGGLGKNILYRVGRGQYRLFDPSRDKPIPEKEYGFKTTRSIEYPELKIEGEFPISRVDGVWRIVIPEKVREVMNLKPGDYIAFTEEGGRIVLRKARFKIELE